MDRLARELARLGARLGVETSPEAVSFLLGERTPEPPPVRRVPAPQARAERRARAVHLAAHAEPVDLAADKPERPRWLPVDPSREGSTRRQAYLRRAAARGSLRLSDWTADAWRIARACMADRSGRTACRWLAGLPRSYALRVRRAALAIHRGPSGELRAAWGWDHVRARRRVALAAVFWHEAQATRRRGMGRVLVGHSRGNVAALFPSSEHAGHLSVSSLFGRGFHGRGDELTDMGDVRALDHVRAILYEQPPASCVPSVLCGRDRDGNPRALGQVWISERASCDALADDDADAADAEAFELPPGAAIYASAADVPDAPT